MIKTWFKIEILSRKMESSMYVEDASKYLAFYSCKKREFCEGSLQL